MSNTEFDFTKPGSTVSYGTIIGDIAEARRYARQLRLPVVEIRTRSPWGPIVEIINNKRN
jgi:hypothetical protein